MEKDLFRHMIQVGLVVSDLENTLDNFEKLLGIGPFRIVDYPPVDEPDCLRMYQGNPSDFTAKFCFFDFGNIELEIIQPLSGSSIWLDFLNEHGPGIHHLKFSMDHQQPARQHFEANGFQCVQEGAAVGKNKGKVWSYFDLQDKLPFCVEIMNEVIV